MLVMMQDRRRPLWPVIIPVLLAMISIRLFRFDGISVSKESMLICAIMGIYVFALILVNLKQYRRWLHENFADLENKEVWQILIVLIAFFAESVVYSLFLPNMTVEILLQIIDILMILILLWRVETLQILEVPSVEDDQTYSEKKSVYTKIEKMLQEQCVNSQYYLHSDISLPQLAKLIGTNNTYLSKYFSQKGQTFNSYINGLRIQYFIHLYEDTLASGRIYTASQLAYMSGFHSYSTFSTVFKQMMGTSVTTWMNQR